MDMFGRVVGMKSKLPSSSGGIYSEPRDIIKGIVISSAATLIAIVVFRYFRAKFNTGLYSAVKNLDTGFFSSL